MNNWEWTFLGTVPYRQALAMQYAYARKVARGANPRLLLLEHPPTITLGRGATRSHLKLSEDEYQRRGVEVCWVQRGGFCTYHGPGQLVGYPIARLDQFRCSVPRWVQGHGEAIIQFLKRRQVEARWSDLHPGVWVDRCKIAAVGFHLSRRISTHGFALNLTTDLSYFKTIVACGIENLQTTSLTALGVRAPEPGQAAPELARLVAETFGESLGRKIDPLEVLEESSDVLAPVALA
jgi:lipoyl(octanoyl) transferase